jgi:glycosyltransferase involved in cell wall biosynthesis
MKTLSVIIPVSVKASNYQNLIQWLESQDFTMVDVIVVLDEANASIERKTEASNLFLAFGINVISGDFGSPGLARNAGISVSVSDWIAFWDADDLPFIGNFLHMVKGANLKGLDVCVGGYILKNIKRGSTEYHELPQVDHTEKLPTLLGKDPGIWRFAFRKAVIQKEFTSIKMGEDQLFLLENNVLDRKIYVEHSFVYCYFYGGEAQATSDKSLIKDLKTAIDFSFNYTISAGASSQSRFAAMLLVKQMLTAIKRGSIQLKFWTVTRLLKMFFRQDVEFISLYRAFKQLLLREKSTDELAFVPLTGGLGNQLFQLAYALNKSRHVKVKVISNIGSPRLNHLHVPEVLSYRLPLGIAELRPSSANWIARKSSGYMLRAGVNPRKFELFPYVLEVAKFLWKSILTISFHKKITPLAANGVGYFDSVPNKISNFDYGYFQSYRWAQSVISELKNLSLAETSPCLLKYSELAEKEMPLVVHVRLGDYRSESSFGFPGVSYYLSSIKSAWESGEYGSIWVFSDEIENVGEFLPLEFVGEYRFIDDPSLSSAEVLEIMRLGKGYVIANSTFSWWGAYLSKFDNPRIFAPKPWFSDIESPKDLVPESWISIETLKSENRFKNNEDV